MLLCFAVIAYILFCGFPPFYDDNNQALFKAIRCGQYEYPSPYWDEVSDVAKDFVDKLLVLDPAKRLTAKQVRKDITICSRRSSPHFI